MMGGSLGAASLHWNAALPPHGRKLQTCPNTADEKWNWWNLELVDTNTKSLEVGETANKKIRYYRNTGKQTPVKTTKKSCCQRLPEGNRKKIMLHKMYLFVIRKSQCRVKLNWMRRKWTRQNRHLLANYLFALGEVWVVLNQTNLPMSHLKYSCTWIFSGTVYRDYWGTVARQIKCCTSAAAVN